MGFLFGQKEKPIKPQAKPEFLVDEAKHGNAQAREDLIRGFTPFALRVAARVCGRYIRLGADDEASIALGAFNEAIDAFDGTRGISFLAFSETVIKRRLVDHYRKESGRREIPLTSLEEEDEEGNVLNPIERDQAIRAHSENQEAEERREEVLRYGEILEEYGISLVELAEVCPRHEDARQNAKEAARVVAGNPEYLAYLRLRRELPLKNLAEEVRVSRKTLERQRKYIIALALILSEDLPYMKEYVRW
ncbi:MAG TPA: RNA polymerase sigma factor SigI [Bacillota bacterium]